MFAANQPLRLALLALTAAMLFSLSACRPEKKALPPPKLTTQQERGRQLFSASCQTCHASQSSEILQGPSLQGLYQKRSLPSGAPANDERVRDAILMGRPNMPGYSYILTDEQVSDLIAYLHTL